MIEMQGKRIEDGFFPTLPGEYSKHIIEDKDVWMVMVPTGGHPFIIGRPNTDGSPYHFIEEHEDGTISVVPQPNSSNSILFNGWHGYIRKGRWVPA